MNSSHSFVLEFLLVGGHSPPGKPAPASQPASRCMIDSEVVPIANTCHFAQDASFLEEGRADVCCFGYASEEGFVEPEQAERESSQGDCSNKSLRLREHLQSERIRS